MAGQKCKRHRYESEKTAKMCGGNIRVLPIYAQTCVVGEPVFDILLWGANCPREAIFRDCFLCSSVVRSTLFENFEVLFKQKIVFGLWFSKPDTLKPWNLHIPYMPTARIECRTIHWRGCYGYTEYTRLPWPVTEYSHYRGEL